MATLLISNIALAYLYLSATGDNRESTGSKHEWGILQSVEYDHRQKPIEKIEFKDVDGYLLVCLPSESDQRAWIMINPKYPPFYKQMPQVQFSLTSNQLDQIRGRRQLTSTVEVCLQTHLIKN